jgi:mannose-6-phosphate isomerase-like protein (cupin superfamily)
VTIIRDLSSSAVAAMMRTDLANASRPPGSLIEPFEFHGCDCGVASFKGQPPWELHTTGDELIHVLAGGTRLTIRGAGDEVVRELRPGDLAVVPSGCWHRNYAPDGVTLFHMTPREGAQHSWDDPDQRPSKAAGRRRA